MELKWFSTNINSCHSNESLRVDAKYRYFNDIENFEVWKGRGEITLSKYLQEISSSKLKKGVLEEPYRLVDLGNIERRSNNLKNVLEVREIGSDKNLLTNGDIVIPKIEPKKGQFFLNLEHNEYVGSTELIEYKIKDNSVNPVFLYYLLVSDKFLSCLAYLESGKTHKRVSGKDLLKIKIPIVKSELQNKLVGKIKPIAAQILELKKEVSDPIEVIDKVFAEEFNYDLTLFEKKRKAKTFKASLFDVANDELKFDISLKSKMLFEEFIKTCRTNGLHFRPIRNNIADVKGGKRLAKGQNVSEIETPFKYVRVDDLSWDGSFDLDNVKYITDENQKPITRYISNTNDILLTIVGATVGKCGLVPEELDGHNITENFARLIVNRELFNPQFLTYCLQSKIVQYQIEAYTGKGSQGKLAIFRIRKLLIPDIALTEQERILNLIIGAFDRQKEIDRQISEKQTQISKLIEDSILSN
ncbi:MAG TPA: restriction endonuclease subunit S [Bacteroidia bacterium]|jgi:type I restriction enzyme S subunit